MASNEKSPFQLLSENLSLRRLLMCLLGRMLTSAFVRASLPGTNSYNGLISFLPVIFYVIGYIVIASAKVISTIAGGIVIYAV